MPKWVKYGQKQSVLNNLGVIPEGGSVLTSEFLEVVNSNRISNVPLTPRLLGAYFPTLNCVQSQRGIITRQPPTDKMCYGKQFSGGEGRCISSPNCPFAYRESEVPK